jgi:hypothetical protein
MVPFASTMTPEPSDRRSRMRSRARGSPKKSSKKRSKNGSRAAGERGRKGVSTIRSV